LRIQGERWGPVSVEDREDIAAKKSLDLLRKTELGQWNLAGRLPGEIASFLGKVARNGLLDHLRKNCRQVRPDPDRPPDRVGGLPSPGAGASGAAQAELLAQRREFAAALRSCADRLQPRSRLVWFFRVFLEMPSREIAAHPDVGLKPAHVDVLLQRAREAIRECMQGKGFAPQDMPPGVFVELWRVFRVGQYPFQETGVRSSRT
jgi:RNA polymerase sigma factor (sigma-70 family)